MYIYIYIDLISYSVQILVEEVQLAVISLAIQHQNFNRALLKDFQMHHASIASLITTSSLTHSLFLSACLFLLNHHIFFKTSYDMICSNNEVNIFVKMTLTSEVLFEVTQVNLKFKLHCLIHKFNYIKPLRLHQKCKL